MRIDEPDETRADVARRRLAQLVASFEADLSTREQAPSAGGDEDRPHRDEREVEPRRAPRRPPWARLGGAHLRVVAVVAVVGVVLLGASLLAGRPQAAEDVPPLTLTGEGASPTPGGPAVPGVDEQPAELVIDVIGEVQRPGIVTVPTGSRVHQAIEAAGGLDGQVDTSGLNLARVLDDGEQIIVGPLPDGAAAAAAAAPDVGAGGPKVRLNLATAEQLEALPGIGPVTAAAIIAWRDENGRFSSVEDLLDVKGIGDVTFDELRDLVVP